MWAWQPFNLSLRSRNLGGKILVVSAVYCSCCPWYVSCWVAVDLGVAVCWHHDVVHSPVTGYFDVSLIHHEGCVSWHGREVDTWDEVSSRHGWLPVFEVVMCIMLKVDNWSGGDEVAEVFNLCSLDIMKVSERFVAESYLVVMIVHSVVLVVCINYRRSNGNIVRDCILQQS